MHRYIREKPQYVRPSSTELQRTQKKLIYEEPAPFVSATHWSIIDRTKGELLFGKRETETRQIASLTKIMTAMVVLDLVKESASNNFAHLDSYVTILESASEMTGTTANLLDRDMLTVEDLIYGMMLPSGNDAA